MYWRWLRDREHDLEDPLEGGVPVLIEAERWAGGQPVNELRRPAQPPLLRQYVLELDHWS